MKTKGTLAIIFLLTFFGFIYYVSNCRVTENRRDYVYRLHAAAMPLPPEVLNILAGEFRGMIANYLVLEAASFVGSKECATDEDWEAVALLLDQSSSLDPYFKQTYRLAQSTLAWDAGKVQAAISILERSRKHLSWDWEPGFFIGFDYFYFLRDNLTASRILMETSRIPGAPISLSTLASRLSSRAGHTSAAIDFLVSIYEKTDDEKAREVLKLRILALQGVLVLQAAVDRFRNQFGRIPQTLDELIDHRVIQSLPQNPYDRPYSIKDGKVDF